MAAHPPRVDYFLSPPDLTVHTPAQKLYLHKAVVCPLSSFFGKFAQAEECSLPADVQMDAVPEMVRYLYGTADVISTNNVYNLLALADRLEINSLTCACFQFITTAAATNPDMYRRVAALAAEKGMSLLLLSTLSTMLFIESTRQTIADWPWHALTADIFMTVIQEKDLRATQNLSEKDLVRLILLWALHKCGFPLSSHPILLIAVGQSHDRLDIAAFEPFLPELKVLTADLFGLINWFQVPISMFYIVDTLGLVPVETSVQRLKFHCWPLQFPDQARLADPPVFKLRDRCDALDTMNKWYPAEVIDINDETNQVFIRYWQPSHARWWSNRYDEWISKTSPRFARLHTYTEAAEAFDRATIHSE
eukprot:GILK01006986.1.p1 GENE.GILK01006986.1~~GILK01006986.1.p1  ORF type:complete len:398 (+),score=41.54 GILK01006986.1:103-1194(+)